MADIFSFWINPYWPGFFRYARGRFFETRSGGYLGLGPLRDGRSCNLQQWYFAFWSGSSGAGQDAEGGIKTTQNAFASWGR